MLTRWAVDSEYIEKNEEGCSQLSITYANGWFRRLFRLKEVVEVYVSLHKIGWFHKHNLKRVSYEKHLKIERLVDDIRRYK